MKGQRIILTGASEGIGRALALELAMRGARIALAARDRERLESLAQECRGRGGEVLAVPTDITNQQDLDWLVAETAKTFGGIDVVVHNAGITMWSRFDALKDLDIFERLIEVNYLAPVRLTALTLPHLRVSRGLIVAIASLAGLTGVPERSG
jgi:short-subunit dehydrogenase